MSAESSNTELREVCLIHILTCTPDSVLNAVNTFPGKEFVDQRGVFRSAQRAYDIGHNFGIITLRFDSAAAVKSFVAGLLPEEAYLAVGFDRPRVADLVQDFAVAVDRTMVYRQRHKMPLFELEEALFRFSRAFSWAFRAEGEFEPIPEGVSLAQRCPRILEFA